VSAFAIHALCAGSRFMASSADWPADPYEFLVGVTLAHPRAIRLHKCLGIAQSRPGLTPAKLTKAAIIRAHALAEGGRIESPNFERSGSRHRIRSSAMTGAGSLAPTPLMPAPQPSKDLKKFPGIGDPGAERILLFVDIAPCRRCRRNATQVAVRIPWRLTRLVTRRTIAKERRLIDAEIPATLAARQRAFLIRTLVLAKTGVQALHAQMDTCPIASTCAYSAARKGCGTEASGSP